LGQNSVSRFFGQKWGFYGNIDQRVEKAGQSRTVEKAGQKVGHHQKAGRPSKSRTSGNPGHMLSAMT